jgi:hypothetical protein
VLTLLQSIVVGGDSIDGADVLRCTSTAEVLGHRAIILARALAAGGLILGRSRIASGRSIVPN